MARPCVTEPSKAHTSLRSCAVLSQYLLLISITHGSRGLYRAKNNDSYQTAKVRSLKTWISLSAEPSLFSPVRDITETENIGQTAQKFKLIRVMLLGADLCHGLLIHIAQLFEIHFLADPTGLKM